MSLEDEAERYRKAAVLTLGQLDWCERYLRTIHKPRLARQIAKNSESIRRRLASPVGDEAADAGLHERA